jgi:hypothetical protein
MPIRCLRSGPVRVHPVWNISQLPSGDRVTDPVHVATSSNAWPGEGGSASACSVQSMRLPDVA